MRSVTCGLLVIALLGCQSIAAFDGIQYERIELVETGETRFDKEAQDKLISRGKNHVLELHFSSARDLASLSYEIGLQIKVFSYFCAHPEEPVLLGYRYVYSGDHNLTRTASVEEIDIQTNPQGRYEYSAYLHLSWLEDVPVPTSDSTENGQMYRTFDLRKAPTEVCIEVFAQGYLKGYRSKTIRISSDDIESAINKSFVPGL